MVRLPVKKLFITLLKISVSAAILGYLVWKSAQGATDAAGNHINVFDSLRNQPLDWRMLAGATACCFVALMLTFVRWWYLVLALDISLRFRDAIRINFWGYLFNLAPLGIVGGDAVKAWMLAHEHPQARAKALASVLFDRVVGLYFLFVLATAAICFSGFLEIDVPQIRGVCLATFVATGIGTVGLAFVLGPDLSHGRSIRALRRIPKIGHFVESVANAVRTYSQRPAVLVASSIMSLGVHAMNALGCYLIARGLPWDVLPWELYFVIMPLSAVAGVLPVSVGPFELTLEFLYMHASVGVQVLPGRGLVVALVYRLITFVLAAFGIRYYLGNRREITEVMHEAEEETA